LSYQHTWFEPGDEFVKFAEAKNLDFVIPPLGKQLDITSNDNHKWWQ